MRTQKEIAEWLKKQEWIEDYKTNIKQCVYNEHEDEKFLNEALAGTNMNNTIDGVFVWADTPQGSKFWVKINYEFLNWYNKWEELNLKKTKRG